MAFEDMAQLLMAIQQMQGQAAPPPEVAPTPTPTAQALNMYGMGAEPSRAALGGDIKDQLAKWLASKEGPPPAMYGFGESASNMYGFKNPNFPKNVAENIPTVNKLSPDLPQAPIEVTVGEDPTKEIYKLFGDTRNGKPIDKTPTFRGGEGGGGSYMKANKMTFGEPVDPLEFATRRYQKQALETALRAANGQTPQSWYEPGRGPNTWMTINGQVVKSPGMGAMNPSVLRAIEAGTELGRDDPRLKKLQAQLLEQGARKGELDIGKGTIELQQAIMDPKERLVQQTLGTLAQAGGPGAELAAQAASLAALTGMSTAQALMMLQTKVPKDRQKYLQEMADKPHLGI